MQQDEPEFSRSCLPRTMALAQGHRRTLKVLIGEGNRRWPLGDRVLVWLAPHWREDIENYRSSSAGNMVERFAQRQLDRMDEHYERELRRRLHLGETVSDTRQKGV